MKAGEEITGTRQELYAKYQLDDILPQLVFSDTIIEWGRISWKCESVIIDENNMEREVLTLRRL